MSVVDISNKTKMELDPTEFPSWENEERDEVRLTDFFQLKENVNLHFIIILFYKGKMDCSGIGSNGLNLPLAGEVGPFYSPCTGLTNL